MISRFEFHDTATRTGKILHYVLRFLQLVMAVTVIGLYGKYVSRANQLHAKQDGRWVYAVVVGSFAAITSLVYMIPFVAVRFFFIWDVILFILWVAVFGIFGKLYIGEHAEGNHGIQEMKSAVWVDLTNMLLWLVSAILGGMLFWKYRGEKTVFTGRAREHTNV